VAEKHLVVVERLFAARRFVVVNKPLVLKNSSFSGGSSLLGVLSQGSEALSTRRSSVVKSGTPDPNLPGSPLWAYDGPRVVCLSESFTKADDTHFLGLGFFNSDKFVAAERDTVRSLGYAHLKAAPLVMADKEYIRKLY